MKHKTWNMKPKAIQVSGKVIHGEHLGVKLGFPTANLDRREYSRRKLKIRLGVYAGFAIFKLKAKSHKLKAGIVIGPIDSSGLPKIEAHLIGFKGNLYDRKLTLFLLKYLRPFRKFDNLRQLKATITKDIHTIKKIL